MKFQNKNVFVSGANRGIGQALVAAALEAGANKVYAAARNTSEIKKLGNPKIIPVTLDITNADSVAAAARLAADTDILINDLPGLNRSRICDMIRTMKGPANGTKEIYTRGNYSAFTHG